MNRERALRILLVLLGLFFVAGIYPLMMFVRREPALAMMLSLYVTLGIFLLLAARNPSANRSLIAFTAWSSFVHAILMAGRGFRRPLAPRGSNRAAPPCLFAWCLARSSASQRPRRVRRRGRLS